MNIIKHFKGIRFNSDMVKIENCIAPPYDVFNYGDDTDSKLRSNPYNIVHIQKPEGEGDSKYENAASVLKNFIDNGTLIEDAKEGIYILEQSWGGSSRTGILAVVKLDETYDKIRPHEKTKKGPITDRFKLTKSTGLNIGSIFVVFNDTDSTVSGMITDEKSSGGTLLYDCVFPGSIRNRLFFSENTDILSMIEEKHLYIADGHHRYQTMLDFRNFCRNSAASSAGEDTFEYTLMFIVPDSEITILPYHRLIKDLDPAITGALPEKVRSLFSVDKHAGIPKAPPKGSIGMFLCDTYYVLTPKENNAALDVELLHNSILEPFLGLDEDKIKSGDYIHYFSGDTDIEEIFKPVREGKYQLGFALNPPEFSDITGVSDKGLTMPRKSTFFYPKVPSGIAMYKAR
ncbi:MAG: DUF1015 domain-containing protein [Elusimicrobiota bacterium]